MTSCVGASITFATEASLAHVQNIHPQYNLPQPSAKIAYQANREGVADAFVDLETRPAEPYSVELNYMVRDGQLYIDPAEGRKWLDYIREDPRVRVRFGDKIYPVTAVLVGRPGELEGFDDDRFIYRLDSRPQ